MANSKGRIVDWEAILTGIFRGKTIMEYGTNRAIFQQGQPADSLFYIRRGKVKLTVVSQQGKEAIVAILSAGEFFGEGCIAGQQLRMATAVAMTDCTLDRIEKSLMTRLLHERHESRNCLSRICFHATFDTKRISSTSFSTQARNGWLGFSCCLLILERKAEPNPCFPGSVRMTWRKWSARPGRGSVIS